MRASEELRYLILAIQREGNRILADALTAHQPVEQALTVLRALASAFPVVEVLSRRSQHPPTPQHSDGYEPMG